MKIKITEAQLKNIKEYLINEEVKSKKIIDLKKLDELASAIYILCNGEYGYTFLNEKINTIWICVGDSNPFDTEYLEMFIKEIVSTSYKVSDEINIIIENEAYPTDEGYKKIEIK